MNFRIQDSTSRRHSSEYSDLVGGDDMLGHIRAASDDEITATIQLISSRLADSPQARDEVLAALGLAVMA